jgi:precorrin-3B synthase
LEGTGHITTPHFIVNHADTLLAVQACPGAPSCTSATVETRNLARALAGQRSGILHVSGCSKGCAHPKAADITLVGENGQFSLIKKGCSWDEPSRKGLSADEILNSTDVL